MKFALVSLLLLGIALVAHAEDGSLAAVDSSTTTGSDDSADDTSATVDDFVVADSSVAVMDGDDVDDQEDLEDFDGTAFLCDNQITCGDCLSQNGNFTVCKWNAEFGCVDANYVLDSDSGCVWETDCSPICVTSGSKHTVSRTFVAMIHQDHLEAADKKWLQTQVKDLDVHSKEHFDALHEAQSHNGAPLVSGEGEATRSSVFVVGSIPDSWQAPQEELWDSTLHYPCAGCEWSSEPRLDAGPEKVVTDIDVSDFVVVDSDDVEEIVHHETQVDDSSVEIPEEIPVGRTFVKEGPNDDLAFNLRRLADGDDFEDVDDADGDYMEVNDAYELGRAYDDLIESPVFALYSVSQFEDIPFSFRSAQTLVALDSVFIFETDIEHHGYGPNTVPISSIPLRDLEVVDHADFEDGHNVILRSTETTDGVTLELRCRFNFGWEPVTAGFIEELNGEGVHCEVNMFDLKFDYPTSGRYSVGLKAVVLSDSFSGYPVDIVDLDTSVTRIGAVDFSWRSEIGVCSYDGENTGDYEDGGGEDYHPAWSDGDGNYQDLDDAECTVSKVPAHQVIAPCDGDTAAKLAPRAVHEDLGIHCVYYSFEAVDPVHVYWDVAFELNHQRAEVRVAEEWSEKYHQENGWDWSDMEAGAPPALFQNEGFGRVPAFAFIAVSTLLALLF